MALGTRDTNTMGEGLRKINGEIADLKFAPDADVPFLIHLETEILNYLVPAQQGQAPGGPGGPGGPPQGGPPPGLQGPLPQQAGPIIPPQGPPGQPGLPPAGGAGGLPPEVIRQLQMSQNAGQ